MHVCPPSIVNPLTPQQFHSANKCTSWVKDQLIGRNYRLSKQGASNHRKAPKANRKPTESQPKGNQNANLML